MMLNKTIFFFVIISAAFAISLFHEDNKILIFVNNPFNKTVRINRKIEIDTINLKFLSEETYGYTSIQSIGTLDKIQHRIYVTHGNFNTHNLPSSIQEFYDSLISQNKTKIILENENKTWNELSNRGFYLIINRDTSSLVPYEDTIVYNGIVKTLQLLERNCSFKIQNIKNHNTNKVILKFKLCSFYRSYSDISGDTLKFLTQNELKWYKHDFNTWSNFKKISREELNNKYPNLITDSCIFNW